MVNCRLKVIGLIDRSETRFVAAEGSPHARTTRQVYFGSGWMEAPVFDRGGLAVGARLSGPAVIDEMSATTLLPPGCSVIVDRAGNLLMDVAA